MYPWIFSPLLMLFININWRIIWLSLFPTIILQSWITQFTQHPSKHYNFQWFWWLSAQCPGTVLAFIYNPACLLLTEQIPRKCITLFELGLSEQQVMVRSTYSFQDLNEISSELLFRCSFCATNFFKPNKPHEFSEASWKKKKKKLGKLNKFSEAN